ncbi:signal peptidase I [Microbacterium sp. KR10-403]|uniref:signal peptidase I n=1 Tax=Microbacterium sp. KR10-403 TaxID=3158581 RepID=UPI0032E4B17F
MTNTTAPKRFLKKTKFTLSLIQWLALGLVALVAIPVGASAAFGLEFSRVVSGSMEPTIMTDDFVVQRAPEPGDLQEGAIVTYRYGFISVTHRVFAVLPDGTAIMKGDNNPTADRAPITQDDLVGVVVTHIPQPAAGFLQQFLSTDEWRADTTKAFMGDWSELPKQAEDAPWAAIIAALVLILCWTIEGFISLIERCRRA